MLIGPTMPQLRRDRYRPKMLENSRMRGGFGPYLSALQHGESPCAARFADRRGTLRSVGRARQASKGIMRRLKTGATAPALERRFTALAEKYLEIRGGGVAALRLG